MTDEQIQQAAALSVHIGRERPDWGTERTLEHASGLVSLATDLTAFNEAECCRPVGDEERDAAERKLEEVARLAGAVGIRADFNGDPRGYSVRLFFTYDAERVPSNTWGGPECGWGIG